MTPRRLRHSAMVALVLTAGTASLATAAVPAGCLLEARTTLGIGNGSTFEGDLRVTDAQGRARIGRDTRGADETHVTGQTVVLGNGTSVFDVIRTTLRRATDATIRGTEAAGTFPIDASCAIPAATCGGDSIQVEKAGASLLLPNSYGDLVVGDGAVIVLTTGAYTFCSIRTGRDVILLLSPGAQTSITVTGDVVLGDGTVLELPPDTGTPLPTIDVGGGRVKLPAHSRIQGRIRSPLAKLSIGAATELTGSACARTIKSGRHFAFRCAPSEPTTSSTSSSTSTSTIVATSSTSTSSIGSTSSTTSTSMAGSTSSSSTTTSTVGSTSSTSTSTSTVGSTSSTSSSTSTVGSTSSTSSTSSTHGSTSSTSSTTSSSTIGSTSSSSTTTSTPGSTSSTSPSSSTSTSTTRPTTTSTSSSTTSSTSSSTSSSTLTTSSTSSSSSTSAPASSTTSTSGPSTTSSTSTGTTSTTSTSEPPIPTTTGPTTTSTSTTTSSSTSTSTTSTTHPALCGNSTVNAGETCDDGNNSDNDSCPADCLIDACTPVTTTQRFVSLQFAPPPGGLVAGLTVLLDYPEGKVDLPGNATTFPSGTLSGAPAGASISVNDLNSNGKGHAVRVTVSGQNGNALSAGQIVRFKFQDCQGATAPTADNFLCTVISASDPFLNHVDGVRCFAVLQ